MNDDSYLNNLQYNSCISRGICSINPRTFALQNVLGLYLQLCAKYCIKLFEKDALKNDTKHFILNTVAISVSNPEFTEVCFVQTISALKKILPELIEKYNELYDAEDFAEEDILSSDIFKKCENIVDSIKFGEYIYQTKVSKIPNEIRNIFKIMLIVAKSISINLLDIESYDNNDKKKDLTEEAFMDLLTLLNSMGINNTDIEKLKEITYKSAESNTKLMKLLHVMQEERYGKQRIVSISYTTTPSKAVLAVGSNIRELETILENLKNTGIDVYTHDDMMVAHTFPKFGEYSNLKGQYGYGLENCLIDFATFPGPIILTKHSLHNIENLYRGRLFTTDMNFYKGVIKIEGEDFSEVISSANEAKGFKRGKVCETVTIGYDYEKCIAQIKTKLDTNLYKKVVVIGIKNYSYENKNYFEKLIKYISDEVLIISFSYNAERENLLHFNACFDSYAVVRIVSSLIDYKLPLNVYLPKCGKNTLTEMIYYAGVDGVSVYMGECEPMMINPSVKQTLQDNFGIKIIGSAKRDAEDVNKLSNG